MLNAIQSNVVVLQQKANHFFKFFIRLTFINSFISTKMTIKEISFSKLHGAGNDFIMLNGFAADIQLQPSEIAHLCHRQFGIGADGLILLLPSADTDFRMIYFNSDGYEGSMCGNGGRSVAVFAWLCRVAGLDGRFEAFDGVHSYKILNNYQNQLFEVELTMLDVNHFEYDDNRLIVNTGSPHCVIRTADLSHTNVYEAGKAIRYSDDFAPDGVNVNFLEIEQDGASLRTYERGVENETLSCGTGVTAAAIALAVWVNRLENSIKTVGGQLNVSMQATKTGFSNIILRGPVTYVYQGKIALQ